MNLPMSWSSAAVWMSSCSRSSEPHHLRDLARVAGDRRGMAGGHRVSHRQRLEHRVEQADLERRQLARALRELLAALEGLDAGAEQVLEDEEHDGEEPDGADPDAAVAVRDAGGEQAGGELRRQHRDVDRRARCPRTRLASIDRLVDGDQSAKFRKFVIMKTSSTTAAKPSPSASPGMIVRRGVRMSRPADDRERGVDDDVAASAFATARREMKASTSDEPAPIAAAGAGPRSAMARTSARNEPVMRTPSHLDGVHVAAHGQDEQQQTPARGAASPRHSSDRHGDGRRGTQHRELGAQDEPLRLVTTFL